MIRRDEHVFVAGMTGSGKTFLAKTYLRSIPYVVVLDLKGKFTWEGENVSIITRLERLPTAKYGKIIYRPVFEEMEEEYYEAFFEWVYRRGNTTVLVDEVMGVCPNPGRIPKWYKGILTRGRELGVQAWSLTQRPSGIPQVIISESTHFFVFNLNLPQDREKLVNVTGAEEFLQKPGKYNFWYFREGMDSAIKARLVRR